MIFISHITLTAWLVVENRRARKQKYAVPIEKGKRSLATRLMPVSGTILVVFLTFHLLDFSLNNHVGPDSFIGGETLGLYGLVYNYFQSSIRIFGYIFALVFLALHLAHAFQSACQTFGIHGKDFSPKIKQASLAIAVILFIGFGSLPIYLKFFVSY